MCAPGSAVLTGLDYLFWNFYWNGIKTCNAFSEPEAYKMGSAQIESVQADYM